MPSGSMQNIDGVLFWTHAKEPFRDSALHPFPPGVHGGLLEQLSLPSSAKSACSNTAKLSLV